jgi:putative addiction module component (TIGR02574 family)
MSNTALKFCVEALSMPRKTRAEIAERLLASLEDEGSSAQAEKAWNNEAMKRYKAFKTGKVKPVRHEAVMREAYAAIAKSK